MDQISAFLILQAGKLSKTFVLASSCKKPSHQHSSKFNIDKASKLEFELGSKWMQVNTSTILRTHLHCHIDITPDNDPSSETVPDVAQAGG